MSACCWTVEVPSYKGYLKGPLWRRQYVDEDRVDVLRTIFTRPDS
jgi:hypothetical protein